MPTRWEITKAVRSSDLPAPSRLIMFVLCDVAQVGTAEIPEKFTPSVSVLADETGLSRSSVQRHLSTLEDAGWIERTRPETPQAMWAGERVKYRLSIPDGCGVPVIPGVVSESDTQVSDVHDGSSTETPGVVSQRPGVVSERPGGGVTVTPLETDLLTNGLTEELEPSSPRKRGTRRGTRIPDDFTITREMREWAVANVPQLAGSRETEKFINYWQAKSGRDGVKLDWPATWRNWMLNAAERQPARASPNGLVERNGRKLKPETAQRLDDRARWEAEDESRQRQAIEGP